MDMADGTLHQEVATQDRLRTSLCSLLPLLENSSTVAVYHRPEIWRLQLHLLACFLIPKAVALPLDQSLSLPEFFSLFVVFYASTSSRSSLQARSLSFNVQPLKAALRSRKSCDKLISCSTHVQPTACKKGSKKKLFEAAWGIEEHRVIPEMHQ